MTRFCGVYQEGRDKEMIQIDIEMPEYCARCPLMVVYKEGMFMPVYLCKAKWKELDHEYVCKTRAWFCPIHGLNGWPVEDSDK